MKLSIQNISLLMVLIFGSIFSSTAQDGVPKKAKNISPLLIGEQIPNATLLNVDGQPVNIKDLVREQPTVMVFYRGGWCPYCNLQLSSLGKIEQDIIDLGYQIIAISPDNYLNLSVTEEKNHLNYTILSDENAEFIQEIGIGFQTPLMVKGYIKTKKHQGKTSNVIPVPTVFVLDQEGTIQFEYINPDYSVRLSEEMLLSILQSLQ